MRIRTQIDVAKARPGRHSDGLTKGLYLIVGAEGRTRRWAFRYTKPGTGRVSEAGLGSADLWTLAEVRELAQENRKRVRLGEDPVETKRDGRRGRSSRWVGHQRDHAAHRQVEAVRLALACREERVYHPDFAFSSSIKTAAPALRPDIRYDDLGLNV